MKNHNSCPSLSKITTFSDCPSRQIFLPLHPQLENVALYDEKNSFVERDGALLCADDGEG